jgi:hypothetical protein
VQLQIAAVSLLRRLIGEQFCSVTVMAGAYIIQLASVRAAKKRRHSPLPTTGSPMPSVGTMILNY